MNAKTVGIIGAGQLGRMLALSAVELDLDFVFLDPSATPGAARFGRHIQAAFDDPAALKELAQRCDALTFEFENIPVTALQEIRDHLNPNPEALSIAQQRSVEKAYFESLGISVARWAAVHSQAELDQAVQRLGTPLIAKTDRLGYDGKGQVRIFDSSDAEGLYERMGSQDLCLEAFVDFDYELSIVGTRGRDGSQRLYSLSRNEHRDGILHRSVALTDDTALSQKAADAFSELAESLDYVGTLAIEFFVNEKTLIANEWAPRVHNSGHWTIEGACTSQFENHIRAICDLPLGESRQLSAVAMQNFIGQMPERQSLLEIPGLHLHDYNKSPREGRKVGHASITAPDQATLEARLALLDEKIAQRV